MSVNVKINGITYSGINSVKLPLADGSGYAQFDYANSATEDGGGSGGTETTGFSITNNLTHVTNSNSASTVKQGGSYSATLTAAEGYVLESVTVTMGSVDITSTVYLDGSINIATVSGDIVITATAKAEPVEVPMTLKSENGTKPLIYADGGDTLYEYYKEGAQFGKVWTSEEKFTEDTDVAVTFDNTEGVNYQPTVMGCRDDAGDTVYYAVTVSKGAANGGSMAIGTYNFNYTVRAGYRFVVFTYTENSSNLKNVTVTKQGA